MSALLEAQPGSTLAAMRAAKRWLLYRLEQKEDEPKPRKMPYYAGGGLRMGELGSPDDLARLASYEEAVAQFNRLGDAYAGLGFALGDGWQGVDLDDVEARGLGDLEPTAPGLVEYSPSGKGCHIIGYGRAFATLTPNSTGIEAYSQKRFFTVTERLIRDAPLTCLADYVEQMLAPRHGGGRTADVIQLPSVELVEVAETVSDQEVLNKAYAADNAPKFNTLWTCQIAEKDYESWKAIGYPSQSEADMALLTMLRFHTKADSQVRRMFLQSGLGQRAKALDDKYISKTLREVHKREARDAQRDALAREGFKMPMGAPTALVVPTPVLDPLKTKTLPEFLAESPVIDFLIDDVFRRGWLYAITGQPGAGKTGAGVVLAGGVAAGSLAGHGHVGPHECNGGPVVYIASENGEDVNQRFRIAVEQGQWSLDMMNRIHVLDRSFMMKERIAEVEAIIDRLQAVCVIVDTDQAVSLGGGTDENSNDARMGHAKNYRRLTRRPSRPTLIVMCHPNGTAGPDALRPRGGSSMLAEIDGNVMLSRVDSIVTFKSDGGKFRGEPFELTFNSKMERSPAIKDTKGRQIAVPHFSAMNDMQTSMAQVSQYSERQRILTLLLDQPGIPQVQMLQKLGWVNGKGEPDAPKLSRTLKRLRDDGLVTAASTLTPAGKKAAKGLP